MIPPTMLAISISAADDPAELDIRCFRTVKETSKKKQCPEGQRSIINEIRRLAGLSFDTEPTDNSVFTMPIFRQDTRSDYSSSLAISNGQLTSPELKTKKETVTVKVSYSDNVPSDRQSTPYKVDLSAKLSLLPDAVHSVTTLGKMLGANGETVYQTGQGLTVIDDYVYFRDKCAGNLSVEYSATGYEQTAEVSGYEDGENNYKTTVWVVSSCGKIQSIDLEVPACFERERPGLNFVPKSGSADILGPDEVNEPPEASPVDLEFEWELCGNHELVGGDKEYFDKLACSGDVCYPGVCCNGCDDCDGC